jgi:DNA-binding winged helix-turn-helix (wHTH) protein
MSTQPVPMHSQEARQSSDNFPSDSPRYVCFGAYHLDLKKEELYRNGARVKIQSKVYQALLALLQKPGEIVTREDLRMQLWPDALVNYDANVNTTMNKLRLALSDSAGQPAFVDTIPRKGYSFIAKVECVDRSPLPKSSASPSAEPSPALAAQERLASLLWTMVPSKWFAAGVVVLVIASTLFGAALVLYAHR